MKSFDSHVTEILQKRDKSQEDVRPTADELMRKVSVLSSPLERRLVSYFLDCLKLQRNERRLNLDERRDYELEATESALHATIAVASSLILLEDAKRRLL